MTREMNHVTNVKKPLPVKVAAFLLGLSSRAMTRRVQNDQCGESLYHVHPVTPSIAKRRVKSTCGISGLARS